MASDVSYRKYLETEPTALMKHLDEWIREKAEVDTSKFKTKDEAFSYGVYLNVALRMRHQASPENQARLEENRRLRLGTAKPKPADEKPAPKRRAAKPKATEVIPDVPAAEPATPKRRGRPRKDAAVPAPETAPAAETPAPKRRGRRPAAKPAETPSNVVPIAQAAGDGEKKTARRRPARRSGEAAF